MQLKYKKKFEQNASIRTALAAATCSLLGTAATPALALGTAEPWEFDIAVLYYGENDGRVNAFEPLIRAKKELADEEFLILKGVVDSLTGASPSGAMPSSQPQTFSGPSGNGSYTAAPNTIPLDDSFLDTRLQLSAEWEKPINRLSKATYGVNVSNEYDFFSLGASATFSWDLNQRNTTLVAGVSIESDTIEPVGGTPIPLAENLAPGQAQNRAGDSESRTLTDLLFGVTQVISPKTIMQFNYSFSTSSGYHADPYKLISVVDDNTLSASMGDPLRAIYEHRPDSRTRHSLFWKTMHHFETDVIDFSYRYLTDDWDITSHTFDLRYTLSSSSGGGYIQPHIRYYIQDAANFYRTNIGASESLPQYLSADYRLGDMTTLTAGLKYAWGVNGRKHQAIRLEYMMQTGDPSDGSRIGNLANQDIVPETNAVILQYQYSF
jgi:hypothetical protein